MLALAIIGSSLWAMDSLDNAVKKSSNSKKSKQELLPSEKIKEEIKRLNKMLDNCSNKNSKAGKRLRYQLELAIAQKKFSNL